MVDSSPHPLSLCNIEVIWKMKLDRNKANEKEIKFKEGSRWNNHEKIGMMNNINEWRNEILQKDNM